MALGLKYETGIATTIQFILLTILNFANGISGSVNQCSNGGRACVSNIIISLVYFLVITSLFAGLWIVGFMAQDKRSKRICQLLIAGESFLALIGLFDLVHHTPSIFSIIISLFELLTAVWVSWLAFRLMLAKGGRVRSMRISKHPKS